MTMMMTSTQAIQQRDALCKEIYGRLFSYIVKQINMSLAPQSTSTSSSTSGINIGRRRSSSKQRQRSNSSTGSNVATATATATAISEQEKEKRNANDLCIGLLDIFGFEIFDNNSFEQLCINYANEKLQQYFIFYVLKKEQEIYNNEELNIIQVIPKDNADVLNLIEMKPYGLLARLDEEVKLSGNDAAYIRKIERDHNTSNSNSNNNNKESSSSNQNNRIGITNGGPSERFNRNHKTKVGHFEIKHFAGLVLYDSDGFVEKNKDKLYDHLDDLLNECNNKTLRKMIVNPLFLIHDNDNDDDDGNNDDNTNTEINTVDTGTIISDKTTGTGIGKQSNTSINQSRQGQGGKNNGNDSNISTITMQSITLSARFQSQLSSLMNILSISSPHFVRCIKPNNLKKPDTLRLPIVLQQLRYSGVLEAIQIRKSGYPIRKVSVNMTDW